ncbi:MAG: type II toxin-antitoxin system VapC family toxin [Acidobacteriota bacterium]
MTRYFLESSAFAKLFVLEQGSVPLIQLLETAEDAHKLVSSLAALEVRSAVRRREREGDISPADASRTLDAVEAEVLRIVEHPVSPAVLDVAKLVLDTHPLRAMDALHLATCLTIRDKLHESDVCFVSADNALLRAAALEKFAVLNPLTI